MWQEGNPRRHSSRSCNAHRPATTAHTSSIDSLLLSEGPLVPANLCPTSLRPLDPSLAHLVRMSCKGIRQALADCILRSDCVLRSDPPRSPQECLKEHSDELPEECQLLRKSFFECKRGMVSTGRLLQSVGTLRLTSCADTRSWTCGTTRSLLSRPLHSRNTPSFSRSKSSLRESSLTTSSSVPTGNASEETSPRSSRRPARKDSARRRTRKTEELRKYDIKKARRMRGGDEYTRTVDLDTLCSWISLSRKTCNSSDRATLLRWS